jgi:DNA-binding NarL/FixJ family response regulator
MTETRIAVVEDHSGYRREPIVVLNRQPGWIIVAECLDADQAIRELPETQPNLVLLDLGLPSTSGLDAIPIIKRCLDRHCAIVVLTVSKSGSDIFNAIQAGACSYIFKGTSNEELVQAVCDIVAGEAPCLSATVSRKLVQWIQQSHETDHHGLSDREWEVLKLAANGKQNAQIATTLSIAVNTVKNHFRNC